VCPDRGTRCLRGRQNRRKCCCSKPALTVGLPHRLLLLVWRLSWGNFSDTPVDQMPKVHPNDPEPRNVNQAGLATRLGVSPSSVSEICAFWRLHGIFRKGVEEVWPEDRGARLPMFGSARVSSNSTNSNLQNPPCSQQVSPFLCYKLAYLERP